MVDDIVLKKLLVRYAPYYIQLPNHVILFSWQSSLSPQPYIVATTN